MKLHIFGFLIYVIFLAPFVFSQVNDDFTDGDLTNGTLWTGEPSLFQVSASMELQTNGIAATDQIHLVTANTLMNNTVWQLTTRYNNNPSSSNFVKIYLTSDQKDLEGPLNGYYIRLGGATGSVDSVEFIRQDTAGFDTVLIGGTAGELGAGYDMGIKVTRDNLGNWELFTDLSQSGAFALRGNAFDNSHTTTTHFGVWVAHTSGRATSYFFDNIYVGPPIVDTDPPTLLQAKIISNTELELAFDETLDLVSSESAGNYDLSPAIGIPAMATLLAPDSTKVLLTFGSPFVNNTSYTVTVEDVEDLSGNPVAPAQSLSFLYFVPDLPAANDVIINEIFADPTPIIGMPDAEWLEIFNRSTKTFDLAGWTIDNGTTTGILPSYILLPGAYLILTSSSDTAKLSSFGNALAPSSWTSLVNTGDDLTLTSGLGDIVNAVSYKISWYRDEVKDDGGYSLERINPGNTGSCPPITNWIASRNLTGGTPGKVNSVFSTVTDITAPRLLSVTVQDTDTLIICFDESMEPAFLADPSGFSLDKGIGNASVSIPVSVDNLCVKVGFSSAIIPGEIYTLSIANQADCSGNLFVNETRQIILGQEAQPFEVVINEIFPDPNPRIGLPEAEFIELYNRTTKVLKLDGFQLSDGGTPAILPSVNIAPNEYIIVCSRNDSLAFSAFGTVVPVNSLPGLNNDGDDIYLRNPAGDLIDYVLYDESWYADLAKIEGGWTLERVDPDFVNCNNGNNWRASLAPSGGTPGTENSIKGVFSDTNPPKITRIRFIDESSLEVSFDEQMDEASLSLTSNYSIDKGIGEPILAFPLQPSFRQVELILATPLDSNTLYTLFFTGLSDCAGNILTGEIQIGLPKPALPGDILINEILFNPYTGGKDFVEIYNASEKVLDLQTIRLGEIFPETDSIFNDHPIADQMTLILPGQLICLTEDVLLQQQTYLPPGFANFQEMARFPSYDDREGECVVFSTSGNVLDRFYYEDDYQFPTLDDDNGVSLERISLTRPTQDPGNWHSAASNVLYATPGYPNSQQQDISPADEEVSLEYTTFSPNDDGDADVLPINYDFDFQGGNARITIHDSHGRLIKNLQQNTLLSTQAGTFFWDGRDEKNTKADVGMYVVLFEVTRQDTGKKLAYKMVCVLAAKL